MSGEDRYCRDCCVTAYAVDRDEPTALPLPGRRQRCCCCSCTSRSCFRYVIPLLLVGSAAFACAATWPCDGCDAQPLPPALPSNATSRLEVLGPAATLTLFVVLYAAASLPFVCGGYSVLNVAGGYVYGLAGGALLAACCATVGAAGVRLAMTGPMRTHALRALSSATACGPGEGLLAGAATTAATAVPSRRLLLQMVIVARLTPVPFGLQNALFSVSRLPMSHYLMATCLGLLPMQILNSYLGSTLRSMDDIFTSNRTPTAWLAFCGQVLLSIGLMICVAAKARKRYLEISKQTGISLVDKVASTLPTPHVV